MCKKDSLASKSTVRSHLARRVRTAMVKSLRKEGYKADGSRLVEDGLPPMTGTASIIPVNTVLTLKYEDLLAQTDLVIQRLMPSDRLDKVRRLEATGKIKKTWISQK